MAGWRSELAGCRSTLSMSKIKVRIFETKYRSFYKTLGRTLPPLQRFDNRAKVALLLPTFLTHLIVGWFTDNSMTVHCDCHDCERRHVNGEAGNDFDQPSLQEGCIKTIMREIDRDWIIFFKASTSPNKLKHILKCLYWHPLFHTEVCLQCSRLLNDNSKLKSDNYTLWQL